MNDNVAETTNWVTPSTDRCERSTRRRTAVASRAVRTPLLVLPLLCILVTLSSVAAAITLRFDIPAQALPSALKTFAEQAKMQLLYRPEVVSSAMSNAVVGDFAAREALDLLLKDTGFEAVFSEGDAATIRPRLRTRSTAVSRAQDAVELEEIVVTGSHIRGVAVSASPLLRFDREHIARTGYSTISEFMESLPQNSGAGASQDTVGTASAVGNDTYGNAINLRGLGVGTTLVLLNGRRLAPGGNSGRFVDISMIPLSAVERVEVLTDGASAIYGSDAVGGVVNIILKKDYDGAETGLRYGRVTEGSLRELEASQSLGVRWEGGGAMVSYQYHDRDALDAGDRDFASGSDVPRTLLPQQKGHGLYATAQQTLSERWSISGDVLYSRRDIENVLTYLSLLNEEKADSEELFGSLGTEVVINDRWDAQLSSSYSKYRHDQTFTRTPLPAGAPVTTDSNVDTDVWSVDALVNGTLATLPGGALRVAMGASHRRENVLPTFGEIIPERHVNAAFAELFIPFFGAAHRVRGIEALDLSVAGRYEDYNDFGNAVTPKLGLRWEPVRGLSVRGTYGESFKAPGLQQLAGGTEGLLAFIPSDFGITLPGDPLVLLRTQAAAPQLREEESKSWTAGFDWQPAGSQFALGVTYFNIEFEGRIDTPLSAGLEEFLGQPEVYERFLVANPDAAFIAARLQPAVGVVDFRNLTGAPFDPAGVGLWADGAVTNLAATRESGVDVAVEHSVDTHLGRFDTYLNATYVMKLENAVTPLAPLVAALNRLNQPIDFRLRAGLAWSRGGLNVSAFANYQDGYSAAPVDPSAHVASWTTFDVQVRYTMDAASRGMLNGLAVGLSVLNLLDKDPPFVASQGSPIPHSGFDSVNATPLGRFISLGVQKSW